MRGKFKIKILLDFEPGRNRGRFPMARVSFTLQHQGFLSLYNIRAFLTIVNGLEMTGWSEMYGNFYILFYYIKRFMLVKLRSGSVPEFCICFVNNETGHMVH